jgi:GxxExxY protein
MSDASRAGLGLKHEAVTHSVIGAFFKVYQYFGFGHLERVYTRAMVAELIWRGHHVECEVPIDVWYYDVKVGFYRADIVVDRVVCVENKSSEQLPKEATRQLLQNLSATDLEVGLLLHFGREPKFYRVISENSKPRGRRRSG